MPVRYIYLRRNTPYIAKNEEGNMWVDFDTRPIVTLAIDVQGDKAVYSYACLNPKDNFNRKLAKALSESRLEVVPYEVDLNGETHRYTISRLVVQDFLTHAGDCKLADDGERSVNRISKHALRAAKRYLKNNPEWEEREPIHGASRTADIAYELATTS